MSHLMISASGIRGIVGQSLTPQAVTEFSEAFGSFCKKKHPKKPFVLAADTRASYTLYKHAVLAGLIAVGVKVIDIGQVPTPTAQQMVAHLNASGAIIITASHNPIMWNGIKLIDEHASFLQPEVFDEFYAYYQKKEWQHVCVDSLGSVETFEGAIETHIEKVLNAINPEVLVNRPLKVLVDVNHGTGALATPKMLDKLKQYGNIEYTLLGPTPDGLFEHTPEPNQQNLFGLQEALKKGNYDIGFAQDPDADRLVILAEDGSFIGEDYSLGLCLDYILKHIEKNSLSRDIVVNLSTSRLIQDIAQSHGCLVHETKIGEPHVTKKIKELKAIAGGEGNGGVIYPAVGWGRDSLTGIVLALCYLATSNKSVSEWVSGYPKYYLCRLKCDLASKEQSKPILKALAGQYPDAQKNTQDGLKLVFDSHWIHIRPSNTEPILRIFCEAPNLEDAEASAQKIKQFVEKQL